MSSHSVFLDTHRPPSIIAGREISTRVSIFVALNAVTFIALTACFSDAYVSQREMFDILLSAKVNANEAKSVISTLDPLVFEMSIYADDVIFTCW
jgi:hypothetical protein